jgi:magnesium-protoporphyrin IX monomethyl ester (oxidative) cyclase
MNVPLIHPSGLLYSEVYLRLEPLGMECVASALLDVGHAPIDLDVHPPQFFIDVRSPP